jgi:hypothetical protein
MSDNDERADSPQNLGDQYGSNNHWQGEYSSNRTFAMTPLTYIITRTSEGSRVRPILEF